MMLLFERGGQFRRGQICNGALMRVRNHQNSVKRNDEKKLRTRQSASFNGFLIGLLAKIKF